MCGHAKVWCWLAIIIAVSVLVSLHLACDCAPGVYNDPGGDAEAYYLPFEAGTRFWCGQGYLGWLSHSQEYAADFIVPIGTPVVAARGGTVIDLNAASDCNSWTILGSGGADPVCRWNFVKVQHGDGTIAVYGHLAHDSVVVQVGQHVARGERIALSGHTGFSFTPHLHFGVSNPPTAAHFADVCGDGEPKFGWFYTSENPGPGATAPGTTTP